jgi:hypothetical protein
MWYKKHGIPLIICFAIGMLPAHLVTATMKIVVSL